MSSISLTPGVLAWACCLGAAVLLPQTASAQGIALSGVGPVNRAFGGVSTGVALDAAGALHWNPAAVTDLNSSEAMFGMELLLPQSQLASSVAPSSLAPGFPPVGLSGADSSEPGVSPIPTMAVVYKPQGSQFTYGLGIFGIAGFSANYPVSTTNPILSPQAPAGIGLGRIQTNAEVYQIVPTVAMQVTDQLSIGIAPTVTLARLFATPGFLSPPDDANGDGFATYEPATGTRYSWGAGFQLGAFYRLNQDWSFGSSVKSPQWFESIRSNSQNELGAPRTLTSRFDYPLIVSLGTGYRGFKKTILGVDVRYFNYKNTQGFGTSGFAPTGELEGLGWDNIWSVATGAQYMLTDCTSARIGYLFNQNPIDSSTAFTNSATPLILQHFISCGLSHEFAPNMILSVAYWHGFQNSVSGPFQTPAGSIAGTLATSTVSADSLSAGVTVRF